MKGGWKHRIGGLPTHHRGPFKRGRIIDLTFAGARALGMDGLAYVTLEVVR